MNKCRYTTAIVLALLSLCSRLIASDSIPNERIDFQGFMVVAQNAKNTRESRRLTEAAFMKMAAESGTIVLDARSADKFSLRHIKGAISLPFTDFTEGTLAKAIPAKTTRVLIYCNNNFLGSPAAFASKIATASLNISTFITLQTYGYSNVYELGPLLDVRTTKLPFAGTEVK